MKSEKVWRVSNNWQNDIGHVVARTKTTALQKARREFGMTGERDAFGRSTRTPVYVKYSAVDTENWQGNPSTRRSSKQRETKAERLMRQQRERRKRERANAASRLLKTMNPASKVSAVRVKRLKGGGITLTPVNVKRTR